MQRNVQLGHFLTKFMNLSLPQPTDNNHSFILDRTTKMIMSTDGERNLIILPDNQIYHKTGSKLKGLILCLLQYFITVSRAK